MADGGQSAALTGKGIIIVAHLNTVIRLINEQNVNLRVEVKGYHARAPLLFFHVTRVLPVRSKYRVLEIFPVVQARLMPIFHMVTSKQCPGG